MPYIILCAEVLLCCIVGYIYLLYQLKEQQITLMIPLFLIFATYGTLLLMSISNSFGEPSLTLVLRAGLIYIGLPILLIQGFVLLRTYRNSAYHRIIVMLSLGFPLVLLLLYRVVGH